MKNKKHQFKVSSQFANKRLDTYLTSVADHLTRARIQKLIKDEDILVNNKPVKSSYLVKTDDLIILVIPPLEIHKTNPEKIDLNVLYEDKDIIVVNKTADMVVHPAPGNWSNTLVNALLFHCKDLSGIGGELKPGIVHRLDKGTSGVIIAAKNDLAHVNLSKQFQDRTVKKIYNALVYGLINNDTGTIDSGIGRSFNDRKKYSTRTRKARTALTEWRVLKRFKKDCTFVEIRLHTGRTHQIRVHFSEAGHPLVGDDVYSHRIQRTIDFSRPALHAALLGIKHPVSEEYMEFTAPLPEDIKNLLSKLE